MLGLTLMNTETEVVVSTAFSRSGHLSNLGIRVIEDGDTLILEGRVSSFYLKQIAQEIARRYTTQTIVNHIEVV